MVKKTIEFDTDVDMLYKSPDLDVNNPINKEMRKFFKKNALKDVNHSLSYTPTYLLGRTFSCSHCKCEFEPDWLKKTTPRMPYQTRGGLFLMPRHTSYDCPKCDKAVEIKLDRVTPVGQRTLFGDEAFRQVDGKKIISYSLIGEPLDAESKAFFKKEFLDLKREIAPAIRPSDWVLHMMDFLSVSKRAKKPHLKHLTEADVSRFIRNFGKLLKKYEDKIHIFNATGVYEEPKSFKKKQERLIKSRVYEPLILGCIHDHTSIGISPRFIFEKTGNDGWAKNLFLGAQLSFAWPFITKVNPVISPEFHRPTYSFYLEIADFVSYIIARYLFLVGEKAKGRKVEIDVDPSVLGKVTYSGFTNNSSVITCTLKCYPIKEFFGGTSWAKAHDRDQEAQNT